MTMSAGPATEPGGAPPWLITAMPAVFVLIWSSGFVVARLGMPHAPPLTFLAWRYAWSVLAFSVWVAISRPAWPRNPAQWLHLAVTGALMHAGYLGGVWAAVKAGLSAGTSALIVGLQPVLTALWIAYSGQEQRLSRVQWLGLALGFCGVLLVVWRKLGLGEVTAWNFGLAIFALLSITVGTLYQKRHVLPCDVRTANLVQLLTALLITAPLALLETESIQLEPGFFAAMAWAVLVSTVGGSSLLYMLIARGAASRVTSLFYLTPPCTALMAWLLFREPLSVLTLAGLVLTALGVWLVVRDPGRTVEPGAAA
jgi:drug/metabolite transporter (DMT)-like permease